jgi:hypothetical protein
MVHPSDDPFFVRFFERVPVDVASTFTAGQLDAIKRAFGARTPGAHAIDIRTSVPFGPRRFYVVFLAGRERRNADRRALDALLQPIGCVANAFIVVAFALIFAGATVATLYAGKRAIGLDLVPGFDMLPDRQIEKAMG